jgi:alkanesulfonate monooxygenase SsuD/methylene tetrahydromethanopterin reductase-like flavin-dependent oxidoreductase (luciferase family)
MEVGRPSRRLVETFDLLRQWWSPELRATSPEGATEFAVRAWERTFRPIQAHLPIYLAAVGPVAMRIAARHADGVVFNDLSSIAFMEGAIVSVRAQAKRAGRDPSGFVFAARSAVTVTDDPERVYEQRKSTVAMIHALPGMERLLQSEGYDVERIIADVRAVMNTEAILGRGGGFGDLRRGGDLAAAKRAIPTELMRELVVAGSVDEVRARLRRMSEIGITHVFLAPPRPGTTAAELGDLIAALG